MTEEQKMMEHGLRKLREGIDALPPKERDKAMEGMRAFMADAANVPEGILMLSANLLPEDKAPLLVEYACGCCQVPVAITIYDDANGGGKILRADWLKRADSKWLVAANHPEELEQQVAGTPRRCSPFRTYASRGEAEEAYVREPFRIVQENKQDGQTRIPDIPRGAGMTKEPDDWNLPTEVITVPDRKRPATTKEFPPVSLLESLLDEIDEEMLIPVKDENIAVHTERASRALSEKLRVLLFGKKAA